MRLKNVLATVALLSSVAAINASAHATVLQFGTLNLTVPSTGASCTLPTNLTAPVPANTTICPIVVQPNNWVGVVSNPTGGADSAKFAVVPATGGTGSVLQNVVPLTSTGSAAGNGQYIIGNSTVTP